MPGGKGGRRAEQKKINEMCKRMGLDPKTFQGMSIDKIVELGQTKEAQSLVGKLYPERAEELGIQPEVVPSASLSYRQQLYRLVLEQPGSTEEAAKQALLMLYDLSGRLALENQRTQEETRSP